MRNVAVLGAVVLAACGGADGGYCVSETSYDLNGMTVREVQTLDPVNRVVDHHREAFDADGLQLEDVQESYVYDGDRLAFEQRTQLGPVSGASQITYAYRDGLLSEVREVGTEGDRVDRYTYDAEGQLVELYRGGTFPSTTTYEWVDGRRVSAVTTAEDGSVVFVEERDYLEAAPSLDADIAVLSGFGELFRRELYDGELLVQRTSFAEDGSVHWEERFGYRSDGQLTWESAGDGDGVWRTAYTYDEDGHVVASASGPDADEDGQLDEVQVEQAWTWYCH